MRVRRWAWLNSEGVSRDESIHLGAKSTLNPEGRASSDLDLVGELLEDFLLTAPSVPNTNFVPDSETVQQYRHYVPACFSAKKNVVPPFVCFDQAFSPRRGASLIRSLISEEAMEATRVSKHNRSAAGLEGLFASSFHELRCLILGQDQTDLIKSIKRILPTHLPGGKSKATFGVTHDNRYIVKFVNKQEEMFLRKYSPALIWYWKRNACEGLASMMVPIIGAFVLPHVGSRTHGDAFVILPNLAANGCEYIFDLKGVAIRSRSPNKAGFCDFSEDSSPRADSDKVPSNQLAVRFRRRMQNAFSGASVYWDNDFRHWIENRPLELPRDTFVYLETAISNDTAFLELLDIVDYSILLVVNYQNDDSNDINVRAGIVDFLRPFTWDKKIESAVKSVNAGLAEISSKFTLGSSSKEDSSALPTAFELPYTPTVIRPDLYGHRFRANVLAYFSQGDTPSLFFRFPMSQMSIAARPLFAQSRRANLVQSPVRMYSQDVSTIFTHISESMAIGDLPRAHNSVIKCIDKRIYDFRFLEPTLDRISESCRLHPSTAVSFLRSLTAVGFYNAQVSLAVVVGLLEAHRDSPLSIMNRAKLLGLMASQRLRVPQVISAISADALNCMESSYPFQSLLDLANLDMLNLSDISVLRIPENNPDLARLCMAFILSPRIMEDTRSVHSYFLPALERLASAAIRDVATGHPRISIDLRVVRYGLRYCYPDIYASVSDSVRELFAAACAENTGSRPNEDMFVNAASDCLVKLNVRHNKFSEKGPFRLDIEETGRKIVWECNSRKRFYVGGDQLRKTAYYDLKTRILRRMGYRVVELPFFHWQRLRNRSARQDYLRMSRHTVLADARERRDTLYHDWQSPVSFDSSNASGSFQNREFLGESFFKKESPKRSWSWSSPNCLPVRVAL